MNIDISKSWIKFICRENIRGAMVGKILVATLNLIHSFYRFCIHSSSKSCLKSWSDPDRNLQILTECLDQIQIKSRSNPDQILTECLVTFIQNFMTVPHQIQTNLEKSLIESRSNPDQIQVKFRSNPYQIQTKFRSNPYHIQAESRPNSGQIQAKSRPNPGQIQIQIEPWMLPSLLYFYFLDCCFFFQICSRF